MNMNSNQRLSKTLWRTLGRNDLRCLLDAVPFAFDVN